MHNLNRVSLLSNSITAQVRKKEGFIIDMDGVIYHRGFVLPGVDR